MKRLICISSFLLLAGHASAQGVATNVNTQNYVLRPSDLIQVDVYQEQDLIRQTRIEADGMVHLKLIKPFRIAGMTIAMAQKEIAFRYYDEEFLVHPRITVAVLEFSPQKVSVLGDVTRAGFVSIPPDRKLTLIEAISSAGDFNRIADKTKVQLKRMDATGKLHVRDINVERIMSNPETRDIELQDGDIIFIPELRSKVNVLGQVNRPGFVPVPADRKLTLVEAISGAGGFTRLARTTKVQLKRKDQQNQQQVQEVDVERIMRDSKTRDIQLRDGDIIYVPERLT